MVSKTELFHCTVAQQYVKMRPDEQQAMSPHELQSALILTMEFSKMYYTR
jgi:hypothetical protein